jgi:hypothetical protein
LKKNLVLENEHIVLWYHPESKIIHHRHRAKLIHSDVLRNVLETGLSLLSRHKTSKWLSDDRMHVVFTTKDVEWSKNDWFPRALDAGWKYWAIVQPENEIGKLNLEQFTFDYSRKGITIKIFKTPEEAYEWLTSF